MNGAPMGGVPPHPPSYIHRSTSAAASLNEADAFGVRYYYSIIADILELRSLFTLVLIIIVKRKPEGLEYHVIFHSKQISGRSA